MRLYQRGKRGTWWVDLGDIAGQRARRSTGTTDLAAAKEYAATLARDLWRTRRLGETPRVTWDQAVVAWLEEHQHLRSIEDIKRILRWLTGELRGMPLNDITDTVVRRIKAARTAVPINRAVIQRAVLAKATPPPEKLTSGATVNRHLAHLSAVLHYAQQRGWLAVVPPIAKAPEPAKRVTWLTRDEAQALLAELPLHLEQMARMALATGLRESNIRLLAWSQVDLARAIAWFEASEMKAGKTHTVPLNDDAMSVLQEQLGRHRRWVFPVPRWEAGTAGNARIVEDEPTGKISNHAWRKACIRAGVPTLRFHDLRHTWASWHVQAGTPLPVLQELGGWASLTMVQRYAHLGHSHVSSWAGNIATAGTTPAQVPSQPAKKTAPEGAVSHRVGWLMGLEPTTTGITKRSDASSASKIKHLRSVKTRKTG